MWLGGCVAGGMHCRSGMHSRGHAWWGVHAMHAPWQILRDTVIRSMSWQYASYWDALLLLNVGSTCEVRESFHLKFITASLIFLLFSLFI